MLGEMGIKPGNPQLSHDAIIERPTLSALGINLIQSHHWQANLLERSNKGIALPP